MKIPFAITSAVLTAALVACGGGGGGGPTAGPLVSVLNPGIWTNSTTSTGVTTTFVGVVTNAGDGGEVWGLTKVVNTAANDPVTTSVSLFTGTVEAGATEFRTTKGEVLSFTSGFQTMSPGNSLVLPQSSDPKKQLFKFSEDYTTELFPLWDRSTSLTSDDWKTSWNYEELESIAAGSDPVAVLTQVEIRENGDIIGTKQFEGQLPCTVTGAVSSRQKSVANIRVKFDCRGIVGQGISEYSGIAFPVRVSESKISELAVWMKRTDSQTNTFKTLQLSRETAN